MDGTIFLIGKDGLKEMKEVPYESEALLQKDLAKYPNLLAGDQINQSDPRRWLLVKKEMGVPGEEDGSGRWAVDHLFLDQDGIPTLVELKRATDTRSRREVVAQMLDYAANAVLYWSLDKIKAAFEATCQEQKQESLQVTKTLLQTEDEITVQKYWNTVETNLRAQKIRLVFMADQIQPELRTIVDFLNSQMPSVEVLAVQIPQFVGEGHRALVPMVLGQTKKPPSPPLPPLDWEKVFFEKAESLNPDAVMPARRILKWAQEQQLLVIWSGGPIVGGFKIVVQHNGTDTKVMSVAADRGTKDGVRGTIEYYLIKRVAPFTERTAGIELVNRLNKIPGLNIDPGMVDDERNRYPGFALTLLQDEQSMSLFRETLNWVIKQIQEPPETAPGS